MSPGCTALMVTVHLWDYLWLFLSPIFLSVWRGRVSKGVGWGTKLQTLAFFSIYLPLLCWNNVLWHFSQESNEHFFFSFSYDECVGPGATQIYIPTDDPPPYSLTDPCQRNEIPINICVSQEEEAAPGTAGWAAHSAVRLQDLQQPSLAIAVISQCCSSVQDSGVWAQPAPTGTWNILPLAIRSPRSSIMLIKVALSFNSSQELRSMEE